MFEDIIAYSENSKAHFLEKVRDDFGNSIERELYTPVITQEHQLATAYEEAKGKMATIERITRELRAIQ